MEQEGDIIGQTSYQKFKGITVEEMQLFLEKNSEYYIKKWDLSKNPSKFSGWNWASFFIGALWLGYRKVYSVILYIIGIFLLTDISSYIFNINSTYSSIINKIIELGMGIILGMYGNTIYFRHMTKKISEIKISNYSSDMQKKEIEKAGGVSWGGVGISILMFIAYGVVSTIIEYIIK